VTRPRWRVGSKDPKIVRTQYGEAPDHSHVDEGGDDLIGFFRSAGDAALAVDAVNRVRDVETLLALFWDDTESLLWHPANQRSPLWAVVGPDGVAPEPVGPVAFSVTCSDTFAWACADAEPVVLPDDLESLTAARREFPGDDWPTLWVCRKRGQRPMPRYTRDMDHALPFVQALFAAGPERESTFLAP
jgi:hypothetical protein